MGRTKNLKKELKTIFENAIEIDNSIIITTSLYPENDAQKDDMLRNAKNTKTSIVITYAGRKYENRTTGLYSTFNALSIFLFSKILGDDNSNVFDIENLLDTVTDILHQKQFVLFEDAPRIAKDEKTGLFEAVIIAGKSGVYPENIGG